MEEEKRAAIATQENQNKDSQILGNKQVNSQEIDPIQAITDAVEKPQHKGLLTYERASESVDIALEEPDPEDLYYGLICQGEATAFYGESGSGKTIFAVQMAIKMAQRRKVLYADFELSRKQFQKRYAKRTTDPETGKEVITRYPFPPNLFRCFFNNDDDSDEDSYTEDSILAAIEQTALECEAEVVFIDNLTYLCAAAEDTKEAAKLMKKLVRLKRKYGWTLIVLTHSPKRDNSLPLTQDSMSGSKKLANLFDAVIALGKSAKDSGIRYIKQCKVRSSAEVYTADNVAVYSIVDENSFLHFKFLSTGVEADYLKTRQDNDLSEAVFQILDLRSKKYSEQKIANELGISKSKVHRALDKYSDLYNRLYNSPDGSQSGSDGSVDSPPESSEPSEPEPELFNSAD